MREKWQLKQVRDLCVVIAGQSPHGSAYNDQGIGLPFYQGKKEFAERLLGPPTTWTTVVTKEAAAGDILMSVRAPVGPINESTQRICIGRGLAAIRAGAGIDRNFLWYSLLWLQPTIKGSAGAVFDSINKDGIEQLSIPLPRPEEQQRIVAILDEAFEGLDRARANAEANLQNARELFAASLREIFAVQSKGWAQHTLMDVCAEFGRGKSRHRPRNDPKLYGGATPFIQTGDLSDATHFITQFRQTYSAIGLSQSKLWPRGTVCIAIVGATIGESGILEFEACFPDSVIGMVPLQDKVESEYIEYLLQFMKSDLKKAGKGSARDNINLATFENRRFPIPNLQDQKVVIDRLNELGNTVTMICKQYSAKIQDLDKLRRSLLQKAFAGELT